MYAKVNLGLLQKVAVLIFGVATTISLAIGLSPLPALDSNSFFSYLSSYNALRVWKGFLQTMLLLPFLGAMLDSMRNFRLYAFSGLLIALGFTLVLIVWERAIFPGVFNFYQEYRVTGLFSALHTGGELIDGYLILMIPFVLITTLMLRRNIGIACSCALFALSIYAVLVTYSRITIVAFFVCGILLVLMSSSGIRDPKRYYRTVLPILLIATFVLVPISRAPYIQSRFEAIEQDLKSRITHWENVIRIKPSDWKSKLFGAGLGSFPRYYYIDSLSAIPLPAHQMISETDDSFLRIHGGTGHYVVQRVFLPDSPRLELQLDLKKTSRSDRLTLLLCEKALLYSYRCNNSSILVEPSESWRSYETKVENFDHRNWRQSQRAVYFGFYFTANHSLDIDNVVLADEGGAKLIRNGDFEEIHDHWYFTSDDHLRWHIKNLALYLWFEFGWIGLLAFIFLVLSPIPGLLQNARRGDLGAKALLTSIIGFLIVSITSSPFDFPRLTFQFFIVLFLSFYYLNLKTVKASGQVDGMRLCESTNLKTPA